MEHVEKQGVGSTDPGVLRLLQEVVASAPRMPAVQFDQMFNSQASDLARLPLPHPPRSSYSSPPCASPTGSACPLLVPEQLLGPASSSAPAMPPLSGPRHAGGRLPRQPHADAARARREAAVRGALRRGWRVSGLLWASHAGTSDVRLWALLLSEYHSRSAWVPQLGIGKKRFCTHTPATRHLIVCQTAN